MIDLCTAVLIACATMVLALIGLNTNGLVGNEAQSEWTLLIAVVVIVLARWVARSVGFRYPLGALVDFLLNSIFVAVIRIAIARTARRLIQGTEMQHGVNKCETLRAGRHRSDALPADKPRQHLWRNRSPWQRKSVRTGPQYHQAESGSHAAVYFKVCYPKTPTERDQQPIAVKRHPHKTVVSIKPRGDRLAKCECNSSDPEGHDQYRNG